MSMWQRARMVTHFSHWNQVLHTNALVCMTKPWYIFPHFSVCGAYIFVYWNFVESESIMIQLRHSFGLEKRLWPWQVNEIESFLFTRSIFWVITKMIQDTKHTSTLVSRDLIIDVIALEWQMTWVTKEGTSSLEQMTSTKIHYG